MVPMVQTADDTAVLIATKDRLSLLLERSLRSISLQTLLPTIVILVNDGGSFTDAEQQQIAERLMPVPFRVVPNERARGVAGAWNTGLQLLHGEAFQGFIAILDDDDEWDAHHLAVNHSVAHHQQANVVVSGLRLTVDNQPITRPLIGSLSADDFLVGNPGWQGSNTFVALDLLLETGGFRDGLQSLNDRDLAYRLLRSPRILPALTGQWTATWHSRSKGTLSARRSPQKLSGLRWFWNLYGSRMSNSQAEVFFERAKNLFGIERFEVVDCLGDAPPHCRSRGDLDGPI